LHGLARAEAMQKLADCPDLPPRWWFGDIFRAGLFADAGAWFIFWLSEEASGAPGAVGPPSARLPLTSTFKVIAEHHEWTGADLVRRWGMADEIAALAGNHHRRSNRSHRPFWPLALVASDVADEIVDSPERARERLAETGAVLDFLRICAERRLDLLAFVRQRIERVADALTYEDIEPGSTWITRSVP
jgi:hypothetical protein